MKDKFGINFIIKDYIDKFRFKMVKKSQPNCKDKCEIRSNNNPQKLNFYHHVR